MVEELLEKIPPEKRWEIAAKTLFRISVLRGVKTVVPLLGKGEGIIAPVWGLEKFEEIVTKLNVDSNKKFLPWVKERFNIPVEDAVEANDLLEVVATLAFGLEGEGYIVEKNPERVVFRYTKCIYMERYKEFDVDYALIPCIRGCPAWHVEGFKAINPKITYKRTKTIPWGDPYCEGIIEFKEE